MTPTLWFVSGMLAGAITLVLVVIGVAWVIAWTGDQLALLSPSHPLDQGGRS